MGSQWFCMLWPLVASGAFCNDFEYIVACMKFAFSLLIGMFGSIFGFLLIRTMVSVMWMSTLMFTPLFHRVNSLADDLAGESSRFGSLRQSHTIWMSVVSCGLELSSISGCGDRVLRRYICYRAVARSLLQVFPAPTWHLHNLVGSGNDWVH